MGKMHRTSWTGVCGFLVLTSAATAQDTQFFFSSQICEPIESMLDRIVNQYGEELLFTGNGVQFTGEGQPIPGGTMFLVNQDTGSWSLLSVYADGYACLSAVGSDFAPYAK